MVIMVGDNDDGHGGDYDCVDDKDWLWLYNNQWNELGILTCLTCLRNYGAKKIKKIF